MKQMHRLMVTSDTYKLASEADASLAAANLPIDGPDTSLWHFRLQRLEAEQIWDSIFSAAGTLDSAVGGRSFEIAKRRRGSDKDAHSKSSAENRQVRRAAYLMRGFSNTREVTAAFLQTFDVDDGRVPCPMRTQTVTAPQSLFLMNSPEVNDASQRFAKRLLDESHDDLPKAVQLGFQVAIGRPPSESELQSAQRYLENNPERLKNFAWLLFNLDEFVYVR
jgi:hypothetical protein